MTTPKDQSGTGRTGPTLHLVHNADATDPQAVRSSTSDEVVAHEGGGDEGPARRGARDASSAHPAVMTVEQAQELLADVDPAAHYRMINGLVRSSHSSVLQELPYTPALPFHDPSCVVVEPDPSTVETIELYARAACPEFDRALVAAFADPARSDLLDAIELLLVHQRANIALVTNHGQIIDIALVIGALMAAMLADDRRYGVLDERLEVDELARRCNVLVSRMVATRQAFNVPAIQVLQSAARIFLSVPQTASRRRAKLDPSVVRANNLLMRSELDRQLERGGQLLAMAASGSQDLRLPSLMHKARAAWRQHRGDDPGESPTLHLQPLYDGTINLMLSCRYVLPVAISLDTALPVCRVGALTHVAHKDDCHRVMDWVAAAHQEATGVSTIYHWHEDDLLTQVRAFLHRHGG